MSKFSAPRVGKLVRKQSRAQRLAADYERMTDRQLRDRYVTEYEAGDDCLAIRLLEAELSHRDAWA